MNAVEFVKETPFQFTVPAMDEFTLGIRVDDNECLEIFAHDSLGYNQTKPVWQNSLEVAMVDLVSSCIQILMADPNYIADGWHMLHALWKYREKARVAFMDADYMRTLH